MPVQPRAKRFTTPDGEGSSGDEARRWFGKFKGRSRDRGKKKAEKAAVAPRPITASPLQIRNFRSATDKPPLGEEIVGNITTRAEKASNNNGAFPQPSLLGAANSISAESGMDRIYAELALICAADTRKCIKGAMAADDIPHHLMPSKLIDEVVNTQREPSDSDMVVLRNLVLLSMMDDSGAAVRAIQYAYAYGHTKERAEDMPSAKKNEDSARNCVAPGTDSNRVSGINLDDQTLQSRLGIFAMTEGLMSLAILAHSSYFMRAARHHTPEQWALLTNALRENAISIEVLVKTRELQWDNILDEKVVGAKRPKILKLGPQIAGSIDGHPHEFVVPESRDRPIRCLTKGCTPRYNRERYMYHSNDWRDEPVGRYFIHKTTAYDPTRNLNPKQPCILPSCTNRKDCRCLPCDITKAPLVELREYDGKGVGVRTLTSIPSGKLLGAYLGSVVPVTIAREPTSYDFELPHPNGSSAQNALIDASKVGNWTRYVNHSCRPNARYGLEVIGGYRYMLLYSKKAIPIFSEITADYGKQFWCAEEKLCVCGSEHCKYDTREKKEALMVRQQAELSLNPGTMERANQSSSWTHKAGDTIGANDMSETDELQTFSPVPELVTPRRAAPKQLKIVSKGKSKKAKAKQSVTQAEAPAFSAPRPPKRKREQSEEPEAEQTDKASIRPSKSAKKSVKIAEPPASSGPRPLKRKRKQFEGPEAEQLEELPTPLNKSSVRKAIAAEVSNEQNVAANAAGSQDRAPAEAPEDMLRRSKRIRIKEETVSRQQASTEQDPGITPVSVSTVATPTMARPKRGRPRVRINVPQPSTEQGASGEGIRQIQGTATGKRKRAGATATGAPSDPKGIGAAKNVNPEGGILLVEGTTQTRQRTRGRPRVKANITLPRTEQGASGEGVNAFPGTVTGKRKRSRATAGVAPSDPMNVGAAEDVHVEGETSAGDGALRTRQPKKRKLLLRVQKRSDTAGGEGRAGSTAASEEQDPAGNRDAVAPQPIINRNRTIKLRMPKNTRVDLQAQEFTT